MGVFRIWELCHHLGKVSITTQKFGHEILRDNYFVSPIGCSRKVYGLEDTDCRLCTSSLSHFKILLFLAKRLEKFVKNFAANIFY